MVVQLTPQLLQQFLDAMKAAGVMRGNVAIPWALGDDGSIHMVTMAVEFTPTLPPLPGEAPTPGGWKGPEHLDAEFKPEEPLP